MLTVKFDRFKYTARRFALWRAAFGFYMLFYVFRVWPFAEELYANTSPYAALGLGRFRSSYFPQTLLDFNSLPTVHALLALSAFASLLILIGCARRSAALVLFLVNAWLFNQQQLSFTPEAGFVNWLVFALIFIPAGEAYSIGRKNPNWQMPKAFYWGAWIVLSFAYFYAGSSKFHHHDPAWMNGEALLDILQFENARFAWYGNAFQFVPLLFMRLATWGALGLQLLTGVFVYFRQLRPWWWVIATGAHVLFLGFFNLAELTWGMILFHLFLFDQLWWDRAVAFFATRKARA